MFNVRRIRSNKLVRYVAITGGTVALTFSVTACGGSDTSNTSDTTGTTPTGAPSFGADFGKIQQCLDAAGVKLKLPDGAPSGAPSGAPPSGAPSFGPGQSPPSGFGGDGGVFAEPKVQRALKACGIALPSAP